MKTMIVSDFTIIKQLLLQQILIAIVIAVFITFSSSSVYAVIPAVTFAGAFTAVFNLVAMDESNNWERYRLSLPLSRTQIVTGRYVFAFIFALAGIIIGCALSLLLVAVIQAFGNSFPFPDLAQSVVETPWEIMGVMVVISLIGILGFIAIVFPLMFRFGMSKAVRFIPLAFAALILIVSAILLSNDGLAASFNDLIASISTPEGILLATITSLVSGLAVYGISCFISTKLYLGREF